MELPPEPIELREIPDPRMPLLQAALLRRSMDERPRVGDLCDHCGRTVLTGERVFVFGGQRIVCELCVEFEPGAPLETRLVHGSEVGQTIRIIDKRGRHAPPPVARPGSARKRLRRRPASLPKPVE